MSSLKTQAREARVQRLITNLRQSPLTQGAMRVYLNKWKYLPPRPTTRPRTARGPRVEDAQQTPFIEAEMEAFDIVNVLTPMEIEHIMGAIWRRGNKI